MGMVAKDLGFCMPPISKVCENRSCEGDTRGSQALKVQELGSPCKRCPPSTPPPPSHLHPSVDPPTPLQPQAMSVASPPYLFPREEHNCLPQAPGVAPSSVTESKVGDPLLPSHFIFYKTPP